MIKYGRELVAEALSKRCRSLNEYIVLFQCGENDFSLVWPVIIRRNIEASLNVERSGKKGHSLAERYDTL